MSKEEKFTKAVEKVMEALRRLGEELLALVRRIKEKLLNIKLPSEVGTGFCKAPMMAEVYLIQSKKTGKYISKVYPSGKRILTESPNDAIWFYTGRKVDEFCAANDIKLGSAYVVQLFTFPIDEK